jgi:hypothetical protein
MYKIYIFQSSGLEKIVQHCGEQVNNYQNLKQFYNDFNSFAQYVGKRNGGEGLGNK